jgi:hypothetical protein
MDMVCANFQPIDAELILKIKPSRRLNADVLAWQPEKSSIFSVRSAYILGLNEFPEQRNFAASSGTPDGRDPCWRKIWNAVVPPKVKLFAWKSASDCLAIHLWKMWHMRYMLVPMLIIYGLL